MHCCSINVRLGVTTAYLQLVMHLATVKKPVKGENISEAILYLTFK